MGTMRNIEKYRDAAELVEKYGGIRAAARESGIPRTTLQYRVKQFQLLNIAERGFFTRSPTTEKPLPSKNRKAYIITSAQNDTDIHKPTWENLLALQRVLEFEYESCEMMVVPFTYRTAAMGITSEERWRKQLMPHMVTNTVALAPDLVLCAELQISPTASRPLSGLDNYTHEKSSVIPHTTFSVRSVPTMKHDPVKFLYTTGAITVPKYIQQKAGQKAEFHHSIGALLVEVDPEGNWFAYQLRADDDGMFYHFNRFVHDGTVYSDSDAIDTIVWGDIHVDGLDPDIQTFIWGLRTSLSEGLIDKLAPKRQVFHDFLDFRSQNHHDIGDNIKVYDRYMKGGLKVVDEVKEAGYFLCTSSRPWCESVIVQSNHDEALIRWLKEVDYRRDPMNARFILECMCAWYEAIDKGTDFYAVEWATRKYSEWKLPLKVKFLKLDESLTTVGNTELGVHGHNGANGRRGSAVAFGNAGKKYITGHTHSAALYQGHATVGMLGKLDQGYNVGLSSWSHTNAIVYANGKVVLFTLKKNKKGQIIY